MGSQISVRFAVACLRAGEVKSVVDYSTDAARAGRALASWIGHGDGRTGFIVQIHGTCLNVSVLSAIKELGKELKGDK